MQQLINSISKSFRSLATPGMVGIFIKSIVITVVCLGLVVAGLAYGSTFAEAHWQSWRYASYIPWLASVGAVILAWMLFPCIMPLIVSFFDESIVKNIEDHEYPPAAPPINIPLISQFFHDLKFAAKAILLNVLVLPLYLIPLVNIFVFYVLNGYLLGGEFYLSVARRHLPYREAVQNRKRNSSIVFLGGTALVFLSTIPLVNLLAPFWSIALMTHLYHANNSALSLDQRKL